MRPGEDPLARLEEPLARLADSPGVVVVDQFEEVFTLCRDEDKRVAFFDRMLALTAERPVVLTMRADFWGECAPYPALRAAMEAHQRLIAPMDAAELRAAIERQAGAVGLRFEADLAATILDQVRGEPGAMPLLQHALLELWQRRHGRWLLASEYRAIGGVQGAIAKTAETVYAGLTETEQERVRDIFVRLTRLDEEGRPAWSGATRGGGWRWRSWCRPAATWRRRRRWWRGWPAPGSSSPAAADQSLRLPGSCRPQRWPRRPRPRHLPHRSVSGMTEPQPADGRDEVEVAHEALIRHWPRLRDWLETDRAALAAARVDPRGGPGVGAPRPRRELPGPPGTAAGGGRGARAPPPLHAECPGAGLSRCRRRPARTGGAGAGGAAAAGAGRATGAGGAGGGGAARGRAAGGEQAAAAGGCGGG